jgi:hypothetical protein
VPEFALLNALKQALIFQLQHLRARQLQHMSRFGL